jgi:hypothetical protein
VPKKSAKKNTVQKVNPPSNVPDEWQKCLKKKTTSSIEIIKLDKFDEESHYDDKSCGFVYHVLIRVKACKRVLTFEGIRSINSSSQKSVKYFLDLPDLKYFLNLPDLLFHIGCYVNIHQKNSLERRDKVTIETDEVKVFGLNSKNQLLVLPLTNIDKYGYLCCENILTKSNKLDDQTLFQHLKKQINHFFLEKFNYEGDGLPIYYEQILQKMSVEDRRSRAKNDDFSGFGGFEVDIAYHKLWTQWNNKNKANKKFNFLKYPTNQGFKSEIQSTFR